MTNPIIKTKITIPPVRAQTVFRDRLHERLNSYLGADASLLLVSAKAGAGKSSLISQWLQSSKPEAAWFSLDVDDNDPERFIRYMVAALEESGVVTDLDLTSAFDAPTLPDPKVMAALFLERCFDASNDVLLVLDDYHLITHSWVHAFVEAIADGIGQAGVLVLITRSDPPMPLARWRARGQMVEIRDSDLRFHLDEIEAFYHEVMDLDISPAQISVLANRTEGWIVGLQMAAITMRSLEQEGRLEEFIQGFGGTNRYILDFLMEEVLQQLSLVHQDFLIETSILDRFSADLCAFVSEPKQTPATGGDPKTERTASSVVNSMEILRQLEEANLFLVALDDGRQWFRYHHLFADLLRNELSRRRTKEDIRRLHARASAWFLENQLVEEAMNHAFAAHDYGAAASIIEDNIVRMLSQSTMPRLIKWIERLPETIMRSRPWIAVYWAITLAFAGQIEGVNELLEDVEKLSADRPDANALIGYAAAIRAYLANLQGEPERTFSLAALSSEYLSDEHINARTMASYALADAHFALDNLPQAEEAYQEMLRMGEKSGQVMFIVSALCELASLRKAQGRLQAAADLYAQAWDQMVELNGLGTRLRCHYEFGLADLLYEWNQLDEAYAHAMKGMDIRSRLGGYYVIGDVPLMRILQARGDSKGALSVLREVDQVVSSAYIQLSGRLTLRAARVIEYLAVGDKERARSFSKQCSGKTDLDILARSSVLLAGERYKQMLELLNPQIQSARTGERTARLIALLCHRALAHEGLGEGQDAEDSIVVALSLARPEGFIRSFLDIDASLARLIQRVIRNYRTKSPDASPINQLVLEYASSLLSAFAMDRDRLKDKVAAMAPRPQPEGEADPLTERELEVLLLLAGGLSNKDLASRLFVAPSTIKQHLKNIYAKLGVHSRTEAVARARELNLLI